jgi:hypothetical protein
MTRNSIITITAAAALIASAILAGGRGNSPGIGGGVSPSRTVVCSTCLSSSHPPVPLGNTGGGSPGAGHIKCARWPC